MIETLLEIAGAAFALMGIVAFISVCMSLTWKLIVACIRVREDNEKKGKK